MKNKTVGSYKKNKSWRGQQPTRGLIAARISNDSDIDSCDDENVNNEDEDDNDGYYVRVPDADDVTVPVVVRRTSWTSDVQCFGSTRYHALVYLDRCLYRASSSVRY